MRIKNEKEIENVIQFQPFTVEYEITNLTGKCIPLILDFDKSNSEHFAFAGEVRTLIHLMPEFTPIRSCHDTDETADDEDGGYILRYTMLPKSLGRIRLPMLNLSKAGDKKDPDSTIPLIKDFTKKIYVKNA